MSQLKKYASVSGNIVASDAVTIQVYETFNFSGDIDADGAVTIQVYETFDFSGDIDADGAVTIQVEEALDLGSTSSLTTDELSIVAQNITALGAITSEQRIDVVARNQLMIASSADAECTDLKCVLQLRAQEILLDGQLTGGDISVISNGSMTIGASISADALGFAAQQGDGAGASVNSWTSYTSSTYSRDEQSASGSGGGHGGNGGDSCWQGA